MDKVEIPLFVLQGKRLKLGEVMKHVHDPVSIIKTPKWSSGKKSRLLWLQLNQMFVFMFQKGLYGEVMSDCNYHSSYSFHWNFFIPRLKISHWLVWTPSSSTLLLCYSVNVNIPPLGLLSVSLRHTSTTLYTTLMLILYMLECL